jgi:hypothetical protein
MTAAPLPAVPSVLREANRLPVSDVVGGVGGVAVVGVVGSTPLVPHPLMLATRNTRKTRTAQKRRMFFIEVAPFLNCSSEALNRKGLLRHSTERA